MTLHIVPVGGTAVSPVLGGSAVSPVLGLLGNDYPDIDAEEKWLKGLQNDLGSMWAAAFGAAGAWTTGLPTWKSDAAGPPFSSGDVHAWASYAQQLQGDLSNAIDAGQTMAKAPAAVLQAPSVRNADAHVTTLRKMLDELANLRSRSASDQQTIASLQGQLDDLKQKLAAQEKIGSSGGGAGGSGSQPQGYSGGAMAAAGAGGGAVGFLAGFLVGRGKR